MPIPLEDDYLFCHLREELAKKLWRGEPGRAEDYFSEAMLLRGTEGVVHLFADEFAILGCRSKIDSRDTRPEEENYLKRLREALRDEFCVSHSDSFKKLKNQDCRPPPDVGFRYGDEFSLGGSRAMLRKWLGRGGQGEVWSASLVSAGGKADHSSFAVKFEHRTNRSGGNDGLSPSVGDRLWGQLLCFLPGISMCWEARVNGRRVVCSEDRSAKSIYDRLKSEEEFSTRDAVRIVERVATTLGCLHALSITHRDVKSANILLDPSDSPWVIDFGLTSRTAEGNRDRRGTPLYVAPEEDRNNPRADVFSLGTVLSELLLGRAWDWKDRTDALTGTPPTPGIPERLIEILDGCLAPRPGFRFAHGLQLAKALRDYLVEDRDRELILRRPGPVAVLASLSLEERVALSCDASKSRKIILDELRKLNVPEEQFSDSTEALLHVVELGIAQQIAEAPCGSLAIDELANQHSALGAFEGNAAWWAIEEWGWLLGKRWAKEPSEESSLELWVFASTLNQIMRIESELKLAKVEDAPRWFRLRYQLMMGHNWLAWFNEERFYSWEDAIRHREYAEHIARELGVSCVILEARVHLANALLRKPDSREADLVRAAELLESVALNDCEEQHLRQRQFLIVQINLRRGHKDGAFDRIRHLMAEIPSDDPERERWLDRAFGLFLTLKAFPEARACLQEMLDKARIRDDRAAEWSIRSSEAALAQLCDEADWQVLFTTLLAETENSQDIYGPIALKASEAYFNANQLDRAIELAQKARKIQQDKGYFVAIVKTEMHLARLFDRAGDFTSAFRCAMLGILTMFDNVDFSCLNMINAGFRFWKDYPTERELLARLFAARTNPGSVRECWDALRDRIEESGSFTDEDWNWYLSRQKKR